MSRVIFLLFPFRCQQIKQECAQSRLVQNTRHRLIAGTMPAAPAAVRKQDNSNGIARQNQFTAQSLLANRDFNFTTLDLRFHAAPTKEILSWATLSHLNAAVNPLFT